MMYYGIYFENIGLLLILLNLMGWELPDYAALYMCLSWALSAAAPNMYA